jgi:transposase
MRDSKLPKRQYTEEFKVEAVRLSESVGGHQAARRLGVPVATLGNWKRKRSAGGISTLEDAINAAVLPEAAMVERASRSSFASKASAPAPSGCAEA